MTTLFDLDRIFLFTLLLARASGLMVIAPLFSERFVPRHVKVLLVGTLGLLMLSFAPAGPPVPENLGSFVLLVATELSVGLVIGFTARLLMQAFEMAGHIIAIQMGFGMAQIMDPLQGYTTNNIGRWFWLVGLAMFLGLNGHHHLLRAMAGTLDILPPGTGLMSAGVLEQLAAFGGRAIATSLQIGAPAIGVLLLTTVGLGILARTVPQMNVFIVGFPLKIAAGLAALILCIPYLIEVARHEVAALVDQLSNLFLAA